MFHNCKKNLPVAGGFRVTEHAFHVAGNNPKKAVNLVTGEAIDVAEFRKDCKDAWQKITLLDETPP